LTNASGAGTLSEALERTLATESHRRRMRQGARAQLSANVGVIGCECRGQMTQVLWREYRNWHSIL